MPTLSVTFCVIFGSYPWEACSFQKENRGGVDLEKRGGGGGRLEEETSVKM